MNTGEMVGGVGQKYFLTGFIARLSFFCVCFITMAEEYNKVNGNHSTYVMLGIKHCNYCF